LNDIFFLIIAGPLTSVIRQFGPNGNKRIYEILERCPLRISAGNREDLEYFMWFYSVHPRKFSGKLLVTSHADL
jgi:hypothetical protein